VECCEFVVWSVVECCNFCDVVWSYEALISVMDRWSVMERWSVVECCGME